MKIALYKTHYGTKAIAEPTEYMEVGTAGYSRLTAEPAIDEAKLEMFDELVDEIQNALNLLMIKNLYPGNQLIFSELIARAKALQK